MIQLIYYSVADTSIQIDDINNILNVSRKNNSENNITGCLLYYNDAFLQILEGDKKIIDTLYAKIEQDQRHYSIRKVYDDHSLQDRLFKNWSMGFYNLENANVPGDQKASFKASFKLIGAQTGLSTDAGQLFWDIADQLVND